MAEADLHEAWKFQFHKVRLKAAAPTSASGDSNVSIPQGTIKRISEFLTRQGT